MAKTAIKRPVVPISGSCSKSSSLEPISNPMENSSASVIQVNRLIFLKKRILKNRPISMPTMKEDIIRTNNLIPPNLYFEIFI
jgi:hypothetical protein